MALVIFVSVSIDVYAAHTLVQFGLDTRLVDSVRKSEGSQENALRSDTRYQAPSMQSEVDLRLSVLFLPSPRLIICRPGLRRCSIRDWRIFLGTQFFEHTLDKSESLTLSFRKSNFGQNIISCSCSVELVDCGRWGFAVMTVAFRRECVTLS